MKTLYSGRLEVTIGSRYIYLLYHGNMFGLGHIPPTNISDLAVQFEQLFGEGTFRRIHKLGEYQVDRSGSAYDDVGYLWAKKIPFKEFYVAIGTSETL